MRTAAAVVVILVARSLGTWAEDLSEPYLIQIGFLQRTPRGRIASKSAYDHLGYRASGVRTQNPLF